MTLVPLDRAQAMVLAECAPLHPRAIPLAESLGCVTSLAICAEEPVPPFANSAMDGFAVRAADTAGAPVRLEVVATIAAGAAPDITVGPGQAARIMTGAPVPPGADAIVMVERTSPAPDGGVTIEVAASVGDHVRPAGDDIASGQEVFPARTMLGPGHLGVLASIGVRRVPVFPRAHVGVLSTGDEVVDAAGALPAGKIRDANRPMLLALVERTGAVAVDLGMAPDDEGAIRKILENALERCDAIVTSGGVSVGDFDYVKAVVRELSGGRFHEMQVAIKPAKPLAFGVVEGKPVFGLPGNPVSSLVSYELFARPALRTMMGGGRDDGRLEVDAVAGEDLRRHPDGKTHFVRVRVEYRDGAFHVATSGGQASHLLRAMALANGLAVLPDGDGAAAGDRVRTILLA